MVLLLAVCRVVVVDLFHVPQYIPVRLIGAEKVFFCVREARIELSSRNKSDSRSHDRPNHVITIFAVCFCFTHRIEVFVAI